jgi:hypothetical protein
MDITNILETKLSIILEYMGDYHFFPNFFPKSLDSFQKFGKVWTSWKKVWKNFSKLYLLGTTILMPLYREL